ncbi:MAG: permease [Geminicoccaceae bacterium]|nr:permease [Geminicoccaceae bacterium]
MTHRRYRRWLRLRFTRARAADVDDEFQFHLAMRARELERQGRTPDAARQEALAQFGDLDDARAYCRAEDQRRMREHRRTLWLDNLGQDLRLALRTLRRHPAFAVSTVLTLGVALALAASAYGVVHAYLVRPLPYPQADRLVRLTGVPVRGQPFPNQPNLNNVDWALADTLFDATVRMIPDGFTVLDGDRPEVVYGAWVSQGYFSVFGMKPAVGREFSVEEYRPGAPVAIISDALWSRRYARDPGVIGRTIRVRSLDSAEGELVTVIGVTPAGVWHINRFTEVLRPAFSPRMPAIARLEPGVTLEQAAERLNAVVRPQLPGVDPAWRMSLYTLQDQYTYRVRPTLVPLLAGAAFLLLIAAGSVAGAQAARTAARRAEMRVRVALGASRGRIVAQLLTETVLIAAVAGVLGALLADVTLGAVGALAGQHLVTGDHGGAGVPGGAESLALGAGRLVSVVGLGVLLGAVVGLLPAVAAVRRIDLWQRTAAALGSQKGTAHSVASPAMRRGMIVAQVAFTMILLVGAGLMMRTVLAISAEPLGFTADNVLKADVMLGRDTRTSRPRTDVTPVLSSVASAPGVRAVALAFPHPFWGFGNETARVNADGGAVEGDGALEATHHIVSPGYFEVLRIPLTSGRDFGPLDDAQATPVAIVSADLARQLWPGQSAVGRRVRLDADSVWRAVVGVVGDTREPVEVTQRPDVYVPHTQTPVELMALLTRVDGDPAALAPAIQQAVARVDQSLPLANIEPMSDVVNRDGQRQRALASVLSVFALLGLGLAMLAVYASLAYLVAQRRREIAIRVAVGAGTSAISSLVLREGVIVVGVGVVFGGVLSLGLTRVLTTQLYGVTATDPRTFGGIALLVGASALLASLSPLQHAMRVHPAEVLRTE